MSSGVRTLEGLGSRLLTERPGRAALTIAGVVLGVAMFTGALLTTITVRAGLNDFAGEVNGQADVIASPPGSSLTTLSGPRGGVLDASTVETLASLPGVEQSVAMFAMPTAFAGPEGEISVDVSYRAAAVVVGADLDDARGVFEVELESGRLPTAGSDEIVLPSGTAADLGAGRGDSVTIATPDGPQELDVVGLLANRGIGRLDRVGFTSLDALRRIADQPEALTQLALRLDADVDARDWVREHEPSVPAGVVISAAASALASFGATVNLLTGAFTVIGAGLLFTAAFLVYLTLSMSVTERTRLFGTMMAVGATRRQIRRVVLTEALFIGIIGAIPGVGLGIAVAVALQAATGRALEEVGSPALVIAPWALVVSAVVGIVTTVASALVPAWRAARIDTTAAIRSTEADTPLRSGSVVTGVVTTGIGAAAIAFGDLELTAVGLVLVLLGVIRLVPHLIAPIARRLAPVVGRLFRSGGRIAVQHLVTERTRSAYTVALVMVVMAMSIVTAVASTSLTHSLERQLTASLGDDLTMAAASTFPTEFVDDLVDVEGVAAVAAESESSSLLLAKSNRENVRIRGIDLDSYFDVANFPFVRGSAEELLNGLEAGDSVMIPEGTARRLNLDLGDSVLLETVHGPSEFEIVATAEIVNLPTTLITSQKIAERTFGAQGIDEILVRIQSEFTPEQVRDNIETDLGDRATFIVSTASELKADIRAQVGGLINNASVLLLLAGIVGTFGLANTMAVSVTKRYREIGVLRAIGARRRNIRDMAIAEAVTLVTVASALAVPLGFLLSDPIFDTTIGQIGDWTIHYTVPWLLLPTLLLVGGVAGVGSAVWPARRAVQLDIDEALRFE